MNFEIVTLIFENFSRGHGRVSGSLRKFIDSSEQDIFRQGAPETFQEILGNSRKSHEVLVTSQELGRTHDVGTIWNVLISSWEVQRKSQVISRIFLGVPITSLEIPRAFQEIPRTSHEIEGTYWKVSEAFGSVPAFPEFPSKTANFSAYSENGIFWNLPGSYRNLLANSKISMGFQVFPGSSGNLPGNPRNVREVRETSEIFLGDVRHFPRKYGTFQVWNFSANSGNCTAITHRNIPMNYGAVNLPASFECFLEGSRDFSGIGDLF